MAQRMQGPGERLTRAGFKRKQEKQRRAQEDAWARKSGPVKSRKLTPEELAELAPRRPRKRP